MKQARGCMPEISTTSPILGNISRSRCATSRPVGPSPRSRSTTATSGRVSAARSSASLAVATSPTTSHKRLPMGPKCLVLRITRGLLCHAAAMSSGGSIRAFGRWSHADTASTPGAGTYCPHARPTGPGDWRGTRDWARGTSRRSSRHDRTDSPPLASAHPCKFPCGRCVRSRRIGRKRHAPRSP